MSRCDDLSDDRVIEITWIEILLTIAVFWFTVQLWPDFYSASAKMIAVPFRFVFNLCDVRQWAWRSYAAANVLALICLVVIRFRRL
jgi:hypothetical protein